MSNPINNSTSIVIIGATGAVGGEALKTLLQEDRFERLTLFGRRDVPGILSDKVKQQTINIFEPATYGDHLNGHDAAICCLGVGEPSKMSKEDFLKIDKVAVLDFAKACKKAGVKHFELLASVGISPTSSSFYLRSKGELVEELKALNFDRLSIFMPSMILTQENRYGVTQGIFLAVWPVISQLMVGPLKPYRGAKVENLGGAMARNVFASGNQFESLSWEDFQRING